MPLDPVSVERRYPGYESVNTGAGCRACFSRRITTSIRQRSDITERADSLRALIAPKDITEIQA